MRVWYMCLVDVIGLSLLPMEGGTNPTKLPRERGNPMPYFMYHLRLHYIYSSTIEQS